MKGRPGFLRMLALALLTLLVAVCGVEWVQAQESGGIERTFPQSKAAIEKALKELQPGAAGRLPVLDGFATSPEHPLDRYQRGYYQSKFEVSAAPSGGSIVRVTVHVTAWYVDPVAARSGYQLLVSNGRLEADLLDQLADQLASRGPQGSPKETPVEASSAPSAAPQPFPSQKSPSKPSVSVQPPPRQSPQV